MDPELGKALTLLGGAIASKDIIVKLVGPTADYIGLGVRDWTERRRNNVATIMAKAYHKLGPRIDEDGAIPAKVIREIIEEGSYCEDELTADYFGGVLASSRTGIARDDRGAAFARLVARLSTYQIRAHFVFYHLTKQIHDRSSVLVEDGEGRALGLFIPDECFNAGMEFSEGEDKETLINHIAFGLLREGLIGEDFAYGPKEYLHQHGRSVPGSGLIISPSPLGVELFLWAHGMGHARLADFLKPETTFITDIPIAIPTGVIPHIG